MSATGHDTEGKRGGQDRHLPGKIEGERELG